MRSLPEAVGNVPDAFGLFITLPPVSLCLAAAVMIRGRSPKTATRSTAVLKARDLGPGPGSWLKAQSRVKTRPG